MSSRLCPFCMHTADSDTCPHCGKNIHYAGSPAHLPAGFVVSGKHPYVLGAALGQGGFGITYIALDMVTNERVAIKEYYPTYCSTRTDGSTVTAYSNQEEVYHKGKERFLDEARTLKTLSDLDSIVDVLDFFEANSTAYLVMEFLEGSSLKEYAQKNGKFPARKFLSQIKPLMEDIQKMHDRGVIHRDIAPDNIILQPDGKMKLIDFGAARSYVGDKSMTVVVKKGFAPVEQYMSKGSTAATDVYALAATIYYCITGSVPPDSAERQYDDAPLQSPISLGAEISENQEKALLKALEIQQKARTQTVREFLEQLRARPEPETPKTKNPIPGPIEPDPPPRKRILAILAAVAAVLALASGFFLLPKNNADTKAPAESKPALQESEKEPAHQETTVPPTTADPSYADKITENVKLEMLAAQYSNDTADWWADFEDDFEQQYPKVDLVLDVVSWNDIYTVVNTRIANGVAPDILNIDTFADYQADGLLLPVHDYMSDETYAKFYPQFLELSSLNGKVWAVPDLASARAFYYNKDIFEELGLDAPATWADIEKAAKAIKQKYPTKYPLGLDMTTDDGHSTFACFALSSGGGFTDSHGSWKLNCPENVQVLSFLTGLVKSGLTNLDPTTQTRYDLQDLFIDGNVAMMVAPDSFANLCDTYSVSYGVVPIPAAAGKQSSTLAVMDRMMCFDNGYTKSELAAITCFFDFFYEDQRYTDWTSLEWFLPATSTGNKFLTATDPSKAVWDDILASSTFLPSEKHNWYDAKVGVIAAMQEVLLGADPQSTLEQLHQDLVH